MMQDGKPAMEEYGVVLDFLPDGRASDVRREPLAQLIGETFFTLLEVTPKQGALLAVGERVYIGREAREKIDRIKGRINYPDLTGAAKSELDHAIRIIIARREADFVAFFNRSGPITIRLHQLELLPGVGKKHMHDIMAEREKAPFANLREVGERVKLLPDPHKLIAERIEEELSGASKYYIMTRPPHQPRPY